VAIPPVQAPSFSSIVPTLQSSSVTPSMDSNSSLPRVLTPSTVAKAIYNQLLTEQLPSLSSVPKKPSSRIRQQRKFGEVVTSDSFLDEIKQKRGEKIG